MKKIKKIITTIICIMIMSNSIQAATNNPNTDLVFKTLKMLNSYEDIAQFPTNTESEIKSLSSIKNNSKLDFKSKVPEFKINSDFIVFTIKNKNFKLKVDNSNNVIFNIDSTSITFDGNDTAETIINKLNLKLSQVGYNWGDLLINRANAQLFEAISVIVASIAVIVILAVGVSSAAEKKKNALNKLKDNLTKTKEACNKLKQEQDANSNFQIPKSTYEDYNLFNDQYVNLCVLEYQHLLLLRKNGVYSNDQLIKDFQSNCNLFAEAKKCILGVLTHPAQVDSSKRSTHKENQYQFDKLNQKFIISK